MSIATGTKLGQYEVQDFIGQGAMGVVYRAYHAQLERTGAIKVMQAITPDPDTVARFRHEAQAIAKLRHPNIVDVYDFGEFQGTPYMIVEYIPGGSLASTMAHGPLDQATALKYLRGIAAGLDYAHNHGVVHRDVKPANVLLTSEDSPVLADFGLAKLLQGTSLKSMTGVTTGTPAYMAPEQVTGHQVGPAADRYSLATIAYEMLTGVIPFDGEALMELLYAQVHREPPPPSSRNPALGAEADAVIMRGLAKDPAARWESATKFVDSLENALADPVASRAAATMVMSPPLASTQPLAGTALADTMETSTEATAYPSPPWTPVAKKREPWRPSLALIASAVVILLLLTGVVAWSLNHRPIDLTLSRGVATPGDTILVTAHHLPSSQRGEIEVHSDLEVYDFRADANGDVAFEMTLPRDIELGDHVVRICWASACHDQTPMRVVAELVAASPTPGATPGATPRSSPSPTPRSSTTPSPTAKPTPSPSITIVSIRQLGQTVVTFHYFYGGSAAVMVCQNNACHATQSMPVAPGANVQVSYTTPTAIVATVPPVAGQAYVKTSCCGQTGAVNVAA